MDDATEQLAQKMGARDAQESARLLAATYELGCPDDMVDAFHQQLLGVLPSNPDPDRVLTHLAGFLSSVRSPLSWLALFEREPDSLETIVRLFTTSDSVAAQLIADPEAFEILRLTGGAPVELEQLRDELHAEAQGCDEESLRRLLRRFRRREMLRIAYGEFMSGHDALQTAQQLTCLADCIVSVTTERAQGFLNAKAGSPRQPDGAAVQCSVLALGNYGGSEISYNSVLDLVFVREDAREDSTRSSRTADDIAGDYFNRLASKILALLTDDSSDGYCYRINTDLRPGGASSTIFPTTGTALDYFDARGRTWERQAYLRTRTAAGSAELGDVFIQQLQHWVFRRYLMRADITGIAALKRRIVRRDTMRGDPLNWLDGAGGIREIKHLVQFLQLLHGAESELLRSANIAKTLSRLASEGAITPDEHQVLDQNYQLFTALLHAQEMIRRDSSPTVSADESELGEFFARLKYIFANSQTLVQSNLFSGSPREFVEHMRQRLDENRKVVDHLLHAAFVESDAANPVTDLVLDPKPDAEHIRSCLEPFGFRDPATAYHHLQSLAVESIAFLSTRRCRHFLSAIAPRLLVGIAATPDPDATLISLTNVTESIGGKAVLWELFSQNPPTQDLALRLCAASPYLISILTSNPGMIDELLDSLMLDALPSREMLADQVQQLCAGADEIAPILQSFKNSMHLRVGARNILRIDPLSRIHAALSDIAEVCLEQVIQHEYHRLVRQLGVPVATSAAPGDPPQAGIQQQAQLQASTTESFTSAELVVLAVGKLGGQEPNYHSDIDLIFLFEGEGHTRSLVPDRRFKSTTNRHFFNQLCQRTIHALTRVGTTGKLYDVDVSLRPLGASGQLVITAQDLDDYFARTGGQAWERLVLCKARPVWGSDRGKAAAMESIQAILERQPLDASAATALVDHRITLQDSAHPGNIKRASGGTMDIEFAVHAMQLASIGALTGPLRTGTVAAIEQLVELGQLEGEEGQRMSNNYTFLRRVESALRLMNVSARHDIPSQPSQLRQVAYLLSDPESDLDAATSELTEQIRSVRRDNRQLFESILGRFLPADE